MSTWHNKIADLRCLESVKTLLKRNKFRVVKFNEKIKIVESNGPNLYILPKYRVEVKVDYHGFWCELLSDSTYDTENEALERLYNYIADEVGYKELYNDEVILEI